MPPPALAEPNCVTLVTLMPPKSDAADRAGIADAAEKARRSPPTTIAVWAAEIVPELKMPPPALAEPNCVTLVTLMPLFAAEIVPELLMPPKKLATPPTRCRWHAEIVPELKMPPPALPSRTG